MTQFLKIRQQWLITFWVYIILSALYSLSTLIYGPIKFEYLENNIIWALITYYCAYLRPGVVWLTLVCWSTPFFLLFYLHHNLATAQQSTLAFTMFVLLYMSLIGLWWQSVRLLRANRQQTQQAAAGKREHSRQRYYDYLRRNSHHNGKIDINSLPEAEVEDITPSKDKPPKR
jgi:hypothetical protein